MEEEYILNSDLKKALGEDFYNYIIKELPTHSFKSFRENELKKDFEANLLEGGGIDDSSSE